MPTEAQYTREFLKQFRIKHPHAVVFKINDRTTSGIPDAAITMSGRTTWLEFKRDKPALTPLQATTLTRLARASEGRSFCIVFHDGRRVSVYDGFVPQHGPVQLRTEVSWDDAFVFLFGATEFGGDVA